MSKLPEPKGDMEISQALFLEMCHMLIEAGTITEAIAIKRYEKNLKRFGSWQ